MLRRILLAALLSGVWLGCGLQTARATYTYTLVYDAGQNADEYRLYRDGFHFGTLLVKPTVSGAMIFRPHPDPNDVNGWGSSYYMNPFLSGGEPGGGTVNGVIASDAGIAFDLSGPINRAGGSYGSFTLNPTFTYDTAAQKVAAAGTLGVNLAGTLAAANADLNLSRIASNYLLNVPLSGGGSGDTGDMSRAHVSYAAAGDARDFDWLPPNQPAHFPQDFSSYLGIDVVGEYNNVDSVALGYPPPAIAAAFKPSLSVAFSAAAAGDVFSFGGIYDVGQSQNPYADNVGVNHLVLKDRTSATSLSITMTLESTPVPEPAAALLACLAVVAFCGARAAKPWARRTREAP